MFTLAFVGDLFARHVVSLSHWCSAAKMAGCGWPRTSA